MCVCVCVCVYLFRIGQFMDCVTEMCWKLEPFPNCVVFGKLINGNNEETKGW